MDPVIISNLIAQFPVAAAGVWVAHQYMKENKVIMNRLLEAFEKEIQSCNDRYQQVFDELMKLKEGGSL